MTSAHLTPAFRKQIIGAALAAEDDRYFNNVRLIPVSNHIVTFVPGRPPRVQADTMGAGLPMKRAAEAVTYDPNRDMAIDRICARHRAWHEAVAAFKFAE